MSKPASWISSALSSIARRKMQEMRWQLILVSLAQPAFDKESSKQKSDVMTEIWETLQGQDEALEEPMTDEDNLALLQMAGRIPVRIINGS